jgi:GT2 family glycosyltransferase
VNSPHALQWQKGKAPDLLSVIVPCHAAAYGLRRCLEALCSQTIPSKEIEILVANHGCNPDVSKLCLEFGVVEVPVEAGGGSYKARNVALEQARGVWIAFTDANKTPTSDWAKNGLAALKTNRGIIAGAVRTLPDPDRGVDAAFLFQLYQSFPVRRYVRQNGFGVTGNLFVSRDVFERVGGFDRSIHSGGDKEFCTRAGCFGVPLVYDGNMVVEHFARSSKEVWIKRARTFAGGVQASLNQEHPARSAWPLIQLIKYLIPPRQIAENPIPDQWNQPSIWLKVYLLVMLARWDWARRILLLHLTGRVRQGEWY